MNGPYEQKCGHIKNDFLQQEVLQEITNEENLLHKLKSLIVPAPRLFKWLFNFNHTTVFVRNDGFFKGLFFLRKKCCFHNPHSDESINYLFLIQRQEAAHLPLIISISYSFTRRHCQWCQNRHKHTERMSRRKEKLMVMEGSASLHLSAGQERKRPSCVGVNVSPAYVSGDIAICDLTIKPQC